VAQAGGLLRAHVRRRADELADGVTGNAGAVDNEGAGATMSLTHSALRGNQSIGGPRGTGATGALGEGIGGAIINAFGSTLTVSNCTLSGNQAIGGDHSTPTAGGFANPATGAGEGGAIVNGGATLFLINSTLVGNQALGGFTDAGPGGIAVGGAISNWGTALTGLPGILYMIDSVVIDNIAFAGHGAAGNNDVPAGFAAGGGLDDSFSATAFVTDSLLAGNLARGGTGGPGAHGGDGLGGGIVVGFTALFSVSGNPVVDNSTLHVTDSTLACNQAIGGHGGSGGNGGDGLGGGIAVEFGSTAAVTHSRIVYNAAQGGEEGAGGSDGHGVGGGVYNVGSFDFDVTTAIRHNHASTSNDEVFP
jgi:hypothetical protein